jgi:hypothetical protein
MSSLSAGHLLQSFKGFRKTEQCRPTGQLWWEGRKTPPTAPSTHLQVISEVPRAYRLNVGAFDNYYLRAADGDMIPLSALVSIEQSI